MFKLEREWAGNEVELVIGASCGAMLLVMTAGAPQAQAPAQSRQGRMPEQVIIRKQVIIRSIRVRPGIPNTAISIRWREARGPRCIAVKSIAGAALLGQDSVDFILRDRSRVRARLNEACPALDYYYGFYLNPSEDGLICADRDMLRSRVGGQCGIERFRILRPVVAP